MVIRTIALLASLAFLLLSPRAPSDGQLTSHVGETSSAPILSSYLRPMGLSRTNKKQKSSRHLSNTMCGNQHCCSTPVNKTLALGKVISLQTGKHYLINQVRLQRCPSTWGCCQSFLEQCVATKTENVSIPIPVQQLVGIHQSTIVNETFTFEQHVQCSCKNRTHQALANYISRELLARHKNADDAFDMVVRICKAVKRRIKKQRYFNPSSRFHVNRNRHRSRGQRKRRFLC